MDILTIDFETYYDKQFSLTRLTTEEYIRDERFQTIGVAVKRNDEPTVWFSGSNAEIRTFLSAYNWKESFCLAHNAMFDAAILSWQFDVRPRGWFDTLSMARAFHGSEVGGSLKRLAEYYELGEKGTEVVAALGKRLENFTDDDLQKYGEYCKNDVDLTYDLFQQLVVHFKKTELRLIDLTIKMFSEPVLELDLPLLEQHLEEVKDKKEALLSACLADKETLMSNEKFARLLWQLGVEPPNKISATTGKSTYAFAKTDEGFKALQEHPDERVQALVAARLGTKSTLEETRTQRFIDIGKRGSLPVPLRYYAAHTGRWGGDDKLNLQNLPRKSALKEAIIAPEGYVLINSDSSQIEARTLAWLAGQTDLVEAFDKGEDVYKIMASKIYHKPEEEISADERFVGKTTILGAGYGMGAEKFHRQLKTFGKDIPVDTCRRILDTYRSAYPMIPRLWNEGQKCLEALYNNKSATFGKQAEAVSFLPMLGFELPSGMFLKYSGLQKVSVIGAEFTSSDQYEYKTRQGIVKIYGGKVVENICQAVARCVVGEQMLRIAKKYKVVLTVHDAVACIAKEEETEEAVAYVNECMRWRPDWCKTLPLNCETHFGPRYG
jgi:DNA polymerase I-like protein with 3'-5' exonuclease and polymerase domains